MTGQSSPPPRFVLSDQNVPAVIPLEGDGGCFKVWLVENTSLSNLTTVFLAVVEGWRALMRCKDKIPKFRNKYSQKRNIVSQSQFPHSCVCERFIYSHDRSPYSAGGNM
jgi:hypothetical protein